MGKGLLVCMGVFAGLFLTQSKAQNCPRILNCPQSTPTFCDSSTNNTALWNAAPFTYSPIVGHANSPEAALNLNLRVLGCNSGGLTDISYILYLDLDNDGQQETVVMSNKPPPAGLVVANNSFNPGFLGGDTVQFDKRLLPDSLLYQFSSEVDYFGDTTTLWVRFSTPAAPYSYVPVILPEGRHRIEWRSVQDGQVRICDRNFKIKDCQAPVVNCKSGLQAHLNTTQTVQFTLAEALLSVSDNITPDSQLVLGIRRMGTGQGFPLNAMGDPQDTVMFRCGDSENVLVEVWAQDQTGNLGHCTAAVLVFDTAGFCPFLPFTAICARTFWNDEVVQDVTFNLHWETPALLPAVSPLSTFSSGCSELASTPPIDTFSLRASKTAAVLNGVTTFDLVLISKHILGLEPFNAAWKITAADVNRSKSVTTFDIVEIRKLILGITQQLPNQTPSWRFFADTCMAWGTPFFDNCSTEYKLPVLPISSYPPHLSFQGVKMGDVNGTASSIDTLQGMAEPRGASVRWNVPDVTVEAGEEVELAVRATEVGQWEGFQFSVQWNESLVSETSLVAGDKIPLRAEHWAVPTKGVLNVSWSEAEAQSVLPGDVLFRFKLKAKERSSVANMLQLSDRSPLKAELYDAAGAVHALEWGFVTPPPADSKQTLEVFAPQPNPTTGISILPIRLRSAETVTLELMHLSGQRVWQSTQFLSEGTHLLTIPAEAMPQSGVYAWRIWAGEVARSGRLVRG